MEFNAGAAIIAGLIGGAAMVVPLYMGIAMIPNQMKMNLFLMLGTVMIFRGGPMAYVAGAMIHAAMSIAFALIHVAVYTAFGLETELAAWGVLFGVVHWVVVGMAAAQMLLAGAALLRARPCPSLSRPPSRLRNR